LYDDFKILNLLAEVVHDRMQDDLNHIDCQNNDNNLRFLSMDQLVLHSKLMIELERNDLRQNEMKSIFVDLQKENIKRRTVHGKNGSIFR